MRKADGSLQKPVADQTCNFNRPVNGKPALFTHDDVITLFHEFGLGLHHRLTRIETAGVSGISGVPWDAVELPSQFMENWCWEPEALAFISGHYETGEQWGAVGCGRTAEPVYGKLVLGAGGAGVYLRSLCNRRAAAEGAAG